MILVSHERKVSHQGRSDMSDRQVEYHEERYSVTEEIGCDVQNRPGGE